MRASIGLSLLLLALCCQVQAGRVDGQVTDVGAGRITAEFPMPVVNNAMMIVLVGSGEAVAGMAISERCKGDGPYTVTGELSFVADASALCPGKTVYVNSANVIATARRAAPVTAIQQTGTTTECAPRVDRDLGLYYYAAGQTVGYGVVGLGFDRTLRLSRGFALEVDGGVATIGSVSAGGDTIQADQLIETAVGRAKFDFGPAMGLYAGYRWSQGRGDEASWYALSQSLQGKEFTGASNCDVGTVQQQGVEYGLTLRPTSRFLLSVGYIPEFRSDYGSLGVRTEPAFTGELRFGGGLRLRGLASDDYWQADLGITIR